MLARAQSLPLSSPPTNHSSSASLVMTAPGSALDKEDGPIAPLEAQAQLADVFRGLEEEAHRSSHALRDDALPA